MTVMYVCMFVHICTYVYIHMYMYIGQGRARVAIMFSGGIDSTLLAALAHRHVPATEPIELVNVCFDRYEAPDRLVQRQ